MNEFECLDEKANQSSFGRLVGIRQPSVKDFIDKGVLIPGQTLKEWLLQYSQRMRDQAAGRGGNDQVNLTRARSDEAVMKTAKMRLEYSREIGVLIYTKDAADAINDWCRFGNREWSQGTHRLVSEIQNKHGIEVDNELVESIVGPTTERIKDHAGELGRGLVSRIESVCEAEE